MHAKPQRIRVRGDENASIRLGANKTIHQRNKSTPALSAVSQNVGLKNAPKRTAFGDVSNTVNPIRPNRDCMSLAGQHIPTVSGKAVAPGAEKKTFILSRPSQRSASVTGLKELLTDVTQPKAIVAPSKQGIIDDARQYTANTRKVLTKRSNAVFKDPPPPIVEAQTKQRTTRFSDEVITEEPATRPSSSHSQQHIEQIPKTNKESIGSLNLAITVSTDVNVPAECEDQRGDAVCTNQNDKISRVGSYDNLDWKAVEGLIVETESSNLHEARLQEAVPGQESETSHDTIDLADAQYDRRRALSDPEDWDDEDENEGDAGYVTAPSYRSRGDNTTGGATTALFPRYNQGVKREIATAKQIVEASITAQDIDSEYWDTSMVAEYGDEIFDYMRQLEIRMLPDAHYMDNQCQIQWSMRAALMDWLVQVHYRFSLLPETLFLCVNYIDRFLSDKSISLGKLQLIGATAILIASKYEEINCPSVKEIVYMVDKSYTEEEILDAELIMLALLQFDLGFPGPLNFLRRISKADRYDFETRTLAKYFLEVTIMDERFVGTPPSFAAAGAHCLARLMLRKGNWSPAHIYYSNYTYSQLYPVISLILECCGDPEKHHSAIFEKYTDRRFKRASLFVAAELKKSFRLPYPSEESDTDILDYGYHKRKQTLQCVYG